MSQPKQIEKVTKPDHILSYFKLELCRYYYSRFHTAIRNTEYWTL
ncbi:MAG: hypothetical protein ACRC36_21420 [Lacrimispora sphenoides]